MRTFLSVIIFTGSAAIMSACAATATETITTRTALSADAATQATVQTVYDGFAAGDMDMAMSTMSDAIVWNEAQGNPYADQNPYIGLDAILSGLFARLGGEWDYFKAEPAEFIIDGPRVAVIGHYTAKNKETGQSMDAPFVHVWTVSDGEITAFQQYTDTHAHVVAMGR